jgi:hypothetical protein
MKISCSIVILACLTLSSVTAGPILYSVAGDGNGVPRSVKRIDTNTSSTTGVVDLGDGSMGFGGGLTYDSGSGTFYTMSDDGVNPSVLSSFVTAGAGAFSPVLPAGYGFFGGLAQSSSTDFFAIVLDPNAFSYLYSLSTAGGGSVTQVMRLDYGFNGGLALNSSSGMLYAISNDENGTSTLNSIDPVAKTFSPFNGLTLGQGFLGGLAFDPGSNLLYALASDPFANSTLYSIDLNGNPQPTVTQLFDTGQGFLNASLTIGPPGQIVSVDTPEPCSLGLTLLGLTLCVVRRRSK